MRQVISGSFPYSPSSLGIQFNLADAPGGVNSLTSPQSSPTNGNTIYVQDQNLTPKPNQNWSMISCSIQSYLSILWTGFFSGGGFTSNWIPGGKLGAIYGGIVLDEYTTILGSPLTSSGFSFGFIQQFPKDKTLVQSMWDPLTDDLPYIQSVSGSISSGIDQTLAHYLAISATISPPNPVEIKQGILPTMGIWMFPSLHTVSPAGGNGIGVTTPPFPEMILVQSSYAVIYDDGL